MVERDIKKIKISNIDDPFINIALDTIKRNKQALLFTSTKLSAEACADRIAKYLKEDPSLFEFSKKLLHTLANPTKQCERLSKVARKGIVFHHAGLHQKQKELVEEYFRKSKIKIICCTPTLAAGVDLPAFRTIIKDLKRYNENWGVPSWIPVLEYQQMAGRAGRPGKEDFGEAILIALTEKDKESLYERYILGEVEDISSKLSSEPVLRVFTLSLIASEIVKNKKELFDFFKRTFFAYQYKDIKAVEKKINKMLSLLLDFGFIQKKEDSKRSYDFISASDAKKERIDDVIQVTLLGKRVSQLYIDPLTAHNLILGIKKAPKKPPEFSILQLISSQLELRPLVKAKKNDYEKINTKISEEFFLTEIPDIYDAFYSEFLDSIKTAMFFEDWINEKTEEWILEKYNIRPGEIKAKIDNADWLLYAMEELARLLQRHEIIKEIAKLRMRVNEGVREELIPLLQLKGIGRVKARKLFNNKIKDLGDVKRSSLSTLAEIIGIKTAIKVKEQLGEKFVEEKKDILKNEKIKDRNYHQTSLDNYG
ncbi:MAG: helicase-related protein [Candidatus Woesearchaeota archaeon]